MCGGCGLASARSWSSPHFNGCFDVFCVFFASYVNTVSLSHTIFHIHLCHTPSSTYIFVTHNLPHASLSHTMFHTQLCHRQLCHRQLCHRQLCHRQLCHTTSSTYIFVTQHLPHTSLSHTIFHVHLCHHLPHKTLSHTHNFVTHHPLSHTIFHIHLCHTPSFTYKFVTLHLLPHTHTHFAWQVWHLVHPSSFYVAGVALCDIASFCVAGAALGNIHLHLAWQAVLGDIHLHIHLRFAWQAWYSWHVAGSGDALGPRRPWHRSTFAWQAWHLATSIVVSCGRRGTLQHPASFNVACAALMTLGWVW